MNKDKEQLAHVESKPETVPQGRPRLFLWFSVLSFISFILTGYLVISAIRPSITNFIVARQEADAVVFANRLANNLLLASDFKEPNATGAEERLSIFLQGLQIPARIAIDVTDQEGTVIASDLSERIGKKLDASSEFENARRNLQSQALFRPLSPSEKELVGTKEVFEIYIPLTFGTSPEVAGIVHSLSRTGFISETIRSVEKDIAMRIGGGFLFLYFAVSIIVWGASKTIRRQARALSGYAATLEVKVGERTREIQAVISSMGEGLVVIDKEERVLLMSKSAEEMLEVSLAGIKGKKWTDIVSLLKGKEKLPREKWPSIQALDTGRTLVVGISEGLYYRTFSGKIVPAAIVASPLLDDKKTVGVVVVIRDVTEEKQLEDARVNFVSISSHQLRTPLTSLRWFTELLQDKKSGPMTPKQKEFTDNIYEAILRMTELVNLLLQVARVEAGRVKVEPIPLNLKEVTLEIISGLGEGISRKKQKVGIHVEPDPFPKIPLDKIIISQVIQNLLVNATLYSHEGKTIDIYIKKDKDFIVYQVADEGIGIPKDQQPRIFEKFFRASNAIKFVPTSNGLGLALAKSLVTGWGGRMWFESEEGQGTAFYFTVPETGMKARTGTVGLTV